ncbi:hypothetical protein [Paenibacillus soyae]|uniref:Uncharacterized protein n=1 Tax=Paenibacillus soyae TaxID=2969249 RepID=A0A9X2MPT3_9BACL|nr:hypothetical protein [Paenibacillus soyae]MCR2803643.1 hypothetical protein [Paenibacillus soyae]
MRILLFSLIFLLASYTSMRPVLIEEDVVNMQVFSNTPRGECHSFDYVNASGKSVIKEVVGWINTSIPTEGTSEFGKYTVLMDIRMNDGKLFTIARAYSWEHGKLPNGYSYSSATPIEGEIVIRNGSETMRAKAPELYDWLENQWKHQVSGACLDKT